jgi:hypothetical protein
MCISRFSTAHLIEHVLHTFTGGVDGGDPAAGVNR